MTRDELIVLLHSATYRPGVKLTVHDLPHAVSLNAQIFVDDSTKADGMSKVFVDMTHTWVDSMLPSLTPEAARLSVRYLLHELEKHEADEWLKFDGHAPFHPHPEAHR